MFVEYCLLSFLLILSMCMSYASWQSSNAMAELFAAHRLRARLATDEGYESCLIIDGSALLSTPKVRSDISQCCWSKVPVLARTWAFPCASFFLVADCLFDLPETMDTRFMCVVEFLRIAV